MSLAITDNTRIMVDGESTTWGEFVFYNKEGMNEEEFTEIKQALLTTGSYLGGGGAAAPFEVRLA